MWWLRIILWNGVFCPLKILGDSHKVSIQKQSRFIWIIKFIDNIVIRFTEQYFELDTICKWNTYKLEHFVDWPSDIHLFYKRKSFSYEQEIRALVQTLDDVPIEKREKDYPNGIYPYGIGIKIDINLLIENIYISPYAPSWFYDLIKSITLKYGYNFNIKKSMLSAKPMF